MVQRHVASDYGWLVILSRPGRSGEDEPGVEAIGSCVYKRRALNTRLSSGTSAGTFACPAGPYRILQRRSRYESRTKVVFCTSSKKGSESRSSRFEPKISLIYFSRGWGLPLRNIYIMWGSKPGLNSSNSKTIVCDIWHPLQSYKKALRYHQISLFVKWWY